MNSSIEALVHSWGDNESAITRLKITSLERWLFHTYEPDKFGGGDFESRLGSWLGSVDSDEDKRTLFNLITKIFYVGPVEFEELYRCAYQGPIARWLIQLNSIDVFAKDAQQRIKQAARETWFCPVTDSFRINAFFHINNLAAGASLRPDWCSLYELGDVAEIQKYITSKGITRLVLLEDFVGGGSQSLDAVCFAAKNFPGLEVLFVPLIICPTGARNSAYRADEICKKGEGSLHYEAVMELPVDSFFNDKSSPFADAKPYENQLRDLLVRTYPTVSDNKAIGAGKPYHYYGYPSGNPTGGLVVMFSNTPDNTLPIIHWRSTLWNPIFPRHSRE